MVDNSMILCGDIKSKKLKLEFKDCKINEDFKERLFQFDIIKKMAQCHPISGLTIESVFLERMSKYLNTVNLCKVTQALLSGMTLLDIDVIFIKNEKLYCKEELMEKCMNEIVERMMRNINETKDFCDLFRIKKEREYKEKQIAELKNRIEVEQKRLAELETVYDVEKVISNV